VDVVEYLGDEQLVHIALGDHALVAKVPVGRKLDHNAELDFSIPRERIYLFDAESEQRVQT
jgi:ABC-type sugar transport system ATPase subunit